MPLVYNHIAGDITDVPIVYIHIAGDFTDVPLVYNQISSDVTDVPLVYNHYLKLCFLKKKYLVLEKFFDFFEAEQSTHL